MTNKIKGVIASAAFIFITALIVFNCGRKEPTDTSNQIIDSLKSVIAAKDIEIQKQDEIITHYAHEYDSTAKVNDSLQDRGVKTVVKYKTIRLQTDTASIIAVCDSLANEYSVFIFQTKETLKAADSLMTAQQTALEAKGSQIENMRALIGELESKLDAQAKELERWKKLAKRRGRAIEW